MKRAFGFLTCLVCLVFLISGASAGEAKKPVKLTKKDLSAPVLAAFENAYPRAKIKGIGTEQKDSTSYFEIESKDGAVERDLLYSNDGKVYEIEESMPVKDLPAVVSDSLSQRCAKGKVVRAERITRGAVIEYEMLMTCPKHRKEVLMDSIGKVLKIEVVGKDDED